MSLTIKKVNAKLMKSPKIEVFYFIILYFVEAIKAKLAELEAKMKGIIFVTP